MANHAHELGKSFPMAFMLEGGVSEFGFRNSFGIRYSGFGVLGTRAVSK
jgi:hypothetical protein